MVIIPYFPGMTTDITERTIVCLIVLNFETFSVCSLTLIGDDFKYISMVIKLSKNLTNKMLFFN